MSAARLPISKKRVDRRSTIALSIGSDRPSMKETPLGTAASYLTLEQVATTRNSWPILRVKILTECSCGEVKNKMPHKISNLPRHRVSDQLKSQRLKRWRSPAKFRRTAQIRPLPWYLDLPETLKEKNSIRNLNRSAASTKITFKIWAKRLLERPSETMIATVILQSMLPRSKVRPKTGTVKKPQLQEVCCNFENNRLNSKIIIQWAPIMLNGHWIYNLNLYAEIQNTIKMQV